MVDVEQLEPQQPFRCGRRQAMEKIPRFLLLGEKRSPNSKKSDKDHQDNRQFDGGKECPDRICFFWHKPHSRWMVLKIKGGFGSVGALTIEN